MTSGILGIIGCPMLEDNLIYSLGKDPESKDVAIVDNKNVCTMCRKMDKRSIPYRLVSEDDVTNGTYVPTDGAFNILVYMIDLGLHAKPEELKSKVEDLSGWMQPHVDAIGFYLGTCGNYAWDIPAWCESKGYKPSAMFCDECGNLCHDCVGVNIAGGPRYLELNKKYPAHFYVFPAMASNNDEFMAANNEEQAKMMEHLTDDMKEVLGIDPGPNGYIRWLFRIGHYENILKIDTGLGDENFDDDVIRLSERVDLKIRDAEPGWASMQPTDDLYAKCKSFLSGN